MLLLRGVLPITVRVFAGEFVNRSLADCKKSDAVAHDR